MPPGQLAAFRSRSSAPLRPQARELKKHINVIRADYKKNMQSSDVGEAQLAVTTYLVDKLALRAGGEKDDDLADTVGVCTLRVRCRRLETVLSPSRRADRARLCRPTAQVGHVTRVPPSTLKFDFLVRQWGHGYTLCRLVP